MHPQSRRRSECFIKSGEMSSKHQETLSELMILA
jgi:hypothetical protein